MEGFNSKVVKISSKVFKDKYPGAFKFFEAYQLNNDIENQGMLEIDTKGRDLMEVVNEWIDNNIYLGD